MSPRILQPIKTIVACKVQSYLSENLAIARDDSNKQPLALARFNGQWRCIGRIMNYPAFVREYKSHPHINVHQLWQSGANVIIEKIN